MTGRGRGRGKRDLRGGHLANIHDLCPNHKSRIRNLGPSNSSVNRTPPDPGTVRPLAHAQCTRGPNYLQTFSPANFAHHFPNGQGCQRSIVAPTVEATSSAAPSSDQRGWQSVSGSPHFRQTSNVASSNQPSPSRIDRGRQSLFRATEENRPVWHYGFQYSVPKENRQNPTHEITQSTSITLERSVPPLNWDPYEDRNSPIPEPTAEEKHVKALRDDRASCRQIARQRRSERKRQADYDYRNDELLRQGEEPLSSARPFNRLCHQPYRARMEAVENELSSLNLPSSSHHIPDFLGRLDDVNLKTPYTVDPAERCKYRAVRTVELKGNDNICIICLNKIVDSTVDLLQCPYCYLIFHEKCVADWLAKYKTCPHCKKPWPADE